MSAPTRDHRPCPKCGATQGRQANDPARCLCGEKLRARLCWTAECATCHLRSGTTPYVFVGAPWFTRRNAAAWSKEHADDFQHPHNRFTLTAVCDCGATYTSTVWADLDQQVRWHREGKHHT